MYRYVLLSLISLSALLLATACGPEPATVVPSVDPPAAVVPTNLPAPTEPLPTPPAVTSVSPTALPPTEPVSTEPLSTEPAATLAPTPSPANADVLHVRAVESAGGMWTFHVTVEHPDSGWEDYADGWDVVTPDGTVLKPDSDSPFTRLLLHPHETEQPFTRSQSGIAIPAGVTQVIVRAHDLVDGFGGREVLVNLTVTSGEGFEVERNE
ncbi:hypothetical protein ACFLWA_03180 [Chloroflexota bacterium]